MPRNRTLIRNLEQLLALERARIGLTIEQLAEQGRVSTRTIRRDLEALEAAGVPLTCDVDEETHRARWRVFNWRREEAA